MTMGALAAKQQAPAPGIREHKVSVWLIGFLPGWKSKAMDNLRKAFRIDEAHAAHLRISMPVQLRFARGHGRLALVLDWLGPSLRSVQRQAAGNVLNPLALQHVAKQSLLRLEALHDTGWLHCDVKPANLLLPQPPISHDMGGDSDARGMSEHDVMQQHAGGSRSDECDSLPPLSLVDFGLSRRWRDPESHKHLQAGSLPTRRAGAPVGTGRFASLRNHAGAPLSRRDDLEALAFSLVWLRVGNLPWNGLMPPPALKAERFAAMLECKRRVGASELSVGMPHGFERFFRSVRDIDFEERPDYCGLATMLQPET